ncbi:hypothetical protein CVT26_004820 [Gymnopilus dilepis]|uniref:Uncharacterized protein n=1 Tax=Gymnopilus dilepis TaxID=231916 RepID=A0A409XZH3_9AGAR|nr:hypothetical protein CVT26_004820 [Gymnopilus dilepis]
MFCPNCHDSDLYHPPCNQPPESCKPCKDLEKLDSRIFQMREALGELLKQRTKLKTEMNAIHDPMSTLCPPEVTSIIFQFCLAFDGWRSWKIGLSILSSVCSAWRTIAHSTPELWTSLSISLSNHSDPKAVDRLRLYTKQWLSRSGELPLHLCIYTRYLPSKKDETATVRPVIDLIKEYFYRCYHLSIDLPHFLLDHFSDAFPGDHQSTSILKTLRIGRIQNTGHFTGSLSLGSREHRPQNVLMDKISFDSVLISWNNVRKVEVHDVCFYDVFRILQQAPQIEECEFQGVGSQEQEPTFLPITCTYAQSFTLAMDESHIDGHARDRFFRNVTLPAVKALTLEGNSFELSSDTLVAFLKRSRASLSKLVLRDMYFWDASLIRLLDDLTSLEELYLRTEQDDPLTGFLDHLSETSLVPSTSKNAFLPRLNFLHYSMVEFSGWEGFPDIFGCDSDIGLSEQRPLRHLQVLFRYNEHGDAYDSDYRIPPRILPKFLRLKELGIDLRLESPSGEDLLQLSIDLDDGLSTSE